MLPEIYCDMDQVLVNFIEGANQELQMQGLPNFIDANKEEKTN